MHNARHAIGSVALALAVLAGCGDDGDSATTTTASTTTTTGATSTNETSSTTADDGVTTIEVEVVEGKPAGGVQRHKVDLGSDVLLRVTSDVAEEVHVHTYDVKVDVQPGVPAEVRFTADIPGVIEVELEHSGTRLLELEIS